MAESATNRPLIGARIGNYEIASLLGEGGMGAVYLARHAVIKRSVAIKVLHPEFAARADAAARWLVEARAAGEIGHPGVVEVIDCGVADLGDRGTLHYIVMEHLEGRPLRDEIAAGPIAPERAIAIAVAVGRALEAAHAKGVIHRDIKPENIFVLARDELAIKVLDFGIAKIVDGPLAKQITQSGTALGTPTYMAPEQLDGQNLDGRVDVYALAIVVYEMLVGRAPYAEETAARGVWRRMNEVPILPDEIVDALPAGIDDLLALALDPDPARRPTMADLVAGLVDPNAPKLHEAATRRLGAARQSAPAPPPPRHTSATRRTRWWLAVAAVGMVAAPVIYFATRSPPPFAAPAPSVPASPSVAPSPPAAPPATVAIQVTSKPAGAEVYVGDEPAPRGTTPAQIVLPMSEHSSELRIRSGRVEIRRTISGLVNETVDVTFPVLPPAASRRVPERTPTPTPDAAPAQAPATGDHGLPYDDSLLRPEPKHP
jgi:serine/threonine-protein kinase